MIGPTEAHPGIGGGRGDSPQPRSLLGTLARLGSPEISNPRAHFLVPRVRGLGLPVLAEGLRGRAVVAGGVDGTGWSVAPGRFEESFGVWWTTKVS